jgi:hypothetical protein
MEDQIVLSNEQKLRIIIAHRDYIRAEARQQAALANLTNVVDVIGKELGVEKNVYDLDIEALTLTKKK